MVTDTRNLGMMTMNAPGSWQERESSRERERERERRERERERTYYYKLCLRNRFDRPVGPTVASTVESSKRPFNYCYSRLNQQFDRINVR